jgi:hypothetical protein
MLEKFQKDWGSAQVLSGDQVQNGSREQSVQTLLPTPQLAHENEVLLGLVGAVPCFQLDVTEKGVIAALIVSSQTRRRTRSHLKLG